MQQQQPARHRLLLLLLLLLLNLMKPATADALEAAASDDPSSVFVDDPKHGNVRMGVKSNLCDTGEANLNKDWDGRSDKEFACTPSRRRQFDATSCRRSRDDCPPPTFSLSEPEGSMEHKCLNQAIRYEQSLPTSGPHRPLWPVWGRYSFVPPQRWLHSLEHGGVVAIHHPCAPAAEVAAFVATVASCLRRHVIFADAVRLSPEMPLALVAYRNKVLMSRFDSETVQRFITEHALRGPEHLAAEGQYSLGLIKRAQIVSDYSDSELCPDRK